MNKRKIKGRVKAAKLKEKNKDWKQSRPTWKFLSSKFFNFKETKG